jgi:thioester reductase-like protein
MSESICSGAARGRVTLLTGATGFLGRELLAAMLARDADDQVILPVRPSHGRSAEQRVARLLEEIFPDEGRRVDAGRRVSALETDLEVGDARLTDRLRESLAGRRVRIVHGAASVSFDMTLAEARRINVGGTQRMLQLALELAPVVRLERFAYVSTAFVAGTREGVCFEDERDVGQDFTNSYERSKCEAEALVSSHRDRLPISVFRPSIVAGHSGTGRTSSFKVLYWPLKAFARRLVVCIPGDPEACYDIVPVDYVAEALLHIAERPEPSAGVYHLTAGSTITLRRAVELAAEFFGVRRIPPFVSPKRFHAVIRPVLWLTLVGPARRVLTTSKVYIPYLSRKLRFDNRHALRALEGSGLASPDMETYLKTVFHYAKESDFGRRSVDAVYST